MISSNSHHMPGSFPASPERPCFLLQLGIVPPETHKNSHSLKQCITDSEILTGRAFLNEIGGKILRRIPVIKNSVANFSGTWNILCAWGMDAGWDQESRKSIWMLSSADGTPVRPLWSKVSSGVMSALLERQLYGRIGGLWLKPGAHLELRWHKVLFRRLA